MSDFSLNRSGARPVDSSAFYSSFFRSFLYFFRRIFFAFLSFSRLFFLRSVHFSSFLFLLPCFLFLRSVGFFLCFFCFFRSIFSPFFLVTFFLFFFNPIVFRCIFLNLHFYTIWFGFGFFFCNWPDPHRRHVDLPLHALPSPIDCKNRFLTTRYHFSHDFSNQFCFNLPDLISF